MFLHHSNAPSSIISIPSGIVIVVRFLQPQKAALPIVFTTPPFGITLFLQPYSNLFSVLSIKQLSIPTYWEFPTDTLILVNSSQLSKTLSPIEATLLGIAMLTNFLQFVNA